MSVLALVYNSIQNLALTSSSSTGKHPTLIFSVAPEPWNALLGNSPHHVVYIHYK